MGGGWVKCDFRSHFGSHQSSAWIKNPSSSRVWQKILKRYDEEYKNKLAQGKLLYQSMYDLDIAEESLRPEFKETLDLYRKQRELG